MPVGPRGDGDPHVDLSGRLKPDEVLVERKLAVHRVQVRPAPGSSQSRSRTVALVPVWRRGADNDGMPAFAAVASSLRRPDDHSG